MSFGIGCVAALLLRVVFFFMAWLRAWGYGVFDAVAGFYVFCVGEDGALRWLDGKGSSR
jgi:predicted cobalt transporter CbtA